MKAIETTYNGCLFRSRLEARWAVFFDAAGIEYRYEPEGFRLSNGSMYLPDFYLPQVKAFVEVKGNPGEDELNKIGAFQNDLCKQHGQICVIVGQIPPEFEDPVKWAYDQPDWVFSIGWDRPYVFCVCPTCGRIGLEFDGRGHRICCHDGQDGKEYSADHPRLMWAYEQARKARFEHGETPSPRALRKAAQQLASISYEED